GQATHPTVAAARKRVAAAALKHGKHVAVASLFGQRDQLEAEGTRIYTLGADVIELGNAFRKLVTDFQKTPEQTASDSVYASK
ncbi:MAG TPA: aldolase, partial [Prosthecobacter sp.]